MFPRVKWAVITALIALVCLAGLLLFTYKETLAPAALSDTVVSWRGKDNSASDSKNPLHIPQLSEQLVRQHAVDNTLIVSYANAHHVDYALNWVTYLMAHNITNYLIGAIDRSTGETLSKVGVKCFALYSDEDGTGNRAFEGDLAFLSPAFLLLGLHRAALARTILAFNVDVVISDLDTVWLHNPLPYFAQFPEADILVSSDWPGATHDDEGLEDPEVMGRYDMNVGFMFLRASRNTTMFAEAWLQEMQVDSSRWDQAEFNRLILFDMFKNHYSWWDGTDRWEKIFEPKTVSSSNKRIVGGFDQTVTVGALPTLMFSSGHVFFSQKLYKRARSPLHVVHANFCAGGAKRHRFRETQLWQRDTPSYYDVKRLLSYDVRHLEPPADFEQLPTRQRVRFHLRSMSSQLQQFWDAAAAAVALNRTLILPQFTCHCDELWHWSLDHTPQWVCRYVGATNMTLPFTCPQDTVLKLLNLYDQPSKYGVAVQYRESVFLQNPRTPAAIKNGVRRVTLQDKYPLPASQQQSKQPTFQGSSQQPVSKQLSPQQTSQQIPNQIPPWHLSQQTSPQHASQQLPQQSSSMQASQQLPGKLDTFEDTQRSQQQSRSQQASQQLPQELGSQQRGSQQESQQLASQQLGSQQQGSQQESQPLGSQQLASRQSGSQQRDSQQALEQLGSQHLASRQTGLEDASQQFASQKSSQLGSQQSSSQHASQQLGSQQRASQQAPQESGRQHASQGLNAKRLGSQHSSELDRLQWQRRLLAAFDNTPSSEPIVTQQPVSWIVTEAELRDALSQYKDERVLHVTDMGHVVLNSYRAWDMRRSHATHDNWRFTLFAAVQ